MTILISAENGSSELALTGVVGNVRRGFPCGARPFFVAVVDEGRMESIRDGLSSKEWTGGPIAFDLFELREVSSGGTVCQHLFPRGHLDFP